MTIMETKFCPKCKTVKTVDLFYKSSKTKDGLYRYCVDCKKLEQIKYREQHLKNCKIRRETKKELVAEEKRISQSKKPEFYKEMKKKYYESNKETILAKMAEYRENNKDVIKERNRRSYLTNPEAFKSNAAKRRAMQKSATPPWLTEEDFLVIKEFFKKASELEKQTGIKYHVDHIVPINGELVCGIHVPWNLQILTAVDNIRKSNKFNEEYSCQELKTC